jgi:hypothetical protein
MPWMAAVGNILGGIGAGGAAKKAAKEEYKRTKKLATLEAMLGRQNNQFDRELDEYYKQLDRQEKRRGLDEFRKFSRMEQIDPNYQNTMPAPTTPTMPIFNQGQYARTEG